MITRDQALAQASAWINGDRSEGEHSEVGIYEFAEGYVVWEIEPSRADPSGPPETVGSGRGVIDKQTGELTLWPPFPVDKVAENYQRKLRGERASWRDQ